MLEILHGKRYIVTKASDDGTFNSGDHIALCADGAITCREAQGWINADDVESASKGMEIEIDKEYYEKRKARMIKELEEMDKS